MASRSDEWISAKEAMMAIGLSKWSLARMRKRKTVRFRKVNARRFVYHWPTIRKLRVEF